MNAARNGQSATTMVNGRVVIVGGDATGSIEVYDPAANSFSSAAVNLGKVNGSGGIDRFRMKIIRTSDNMVVYDNKMGDSDDTDSIPMALSGGSINIQKN